MTAHQKGPATVLVVEDEALIKLSAVHAVEDQGYLALSAGNADEALLMLRAHGEIDVLFTDINMPGSMDGLALANRTRDDYPDVEIVVASGNPKPAPGRMPLRSTFLQKPYGPDQVTDILRGLIDQTRPFVC